MHLLPVWQNYYQQQRVNGWHVRPFIPRTTRRRLFLLLIALTVFSALVITQTGPFRGNTLIRDLGYLTRPVWDSSDPVPHHIIPHYAIGTPITASHAPEEKHNGEVDICALHGWSHLHNTVDGPRRPPPRVFDAFLASVEVDLAEIRLRELVDVVDRFLILESTRAFSGAPRHDIQNASSAPPVSPFMRALAAGRFDFAAPKIVHQLVDTFDPAPPSPWANERALRVAMDALIRGSSGIAPEDILLMSDIDEIPSARTLALLKACAPGWPSPLHLHMPNYRYSFEFPLRDGGHWRAKAVRWAEEGVWYNHVEASQDMLAHAGWHCSWCFRYVEDFQFKMQGYSHNDRLTSPKQLEPARISKHTCDGSDIFDMYPEAYSFRSLWAEIGPPQRATAFLDIPDSVVRYADRFAFLLPGGCAREHRDASGV